ncbi:hypothetical protein [Burkholderia ambifaria]|uniref:hypothetical protein n=1 Tax=Burkholderia ambifaria TaxID=152480 RepID=UPI001ABA31E1|nr:hypothetical protein [Burkholderia ambifaria]
MKGFEYEIATPERLIKFDKSPDFRGTRVSRRRPSPAALSGRFRTAGPPAGTSTRLAIGTRSHRTVSSSDGLQPARAPRRLMVANRRQHRCALPPISIIVLVRRIIRPGFVNP